MAPKPQAMTEFEKARIVQGDRLITELAGFVRAVTRLAATSEKYVTAYERSTEPRKPVRQIVRFSAPTKETRKK